MRAVSHIRDNVGESPVWSVVEQALYWVDIEGRQIRRYDLASRSVWSWDTDERIGSIVLREHGGLVAGMESGIFEIDLPDGIPHALARLLVSMSFPQPGMRFNDEQHHEDVDQDLQLGAQPVGCSTRKDSSPM